jgi:hypothetical protein
LLRIVSISDNLEGSVIGGVLESYVSNTVPVTLSHDPVVWYLVGLFVFFEIRDRSNCFFCIASMAADLRR